MKKISMFLILSFIFGWGLQFVSINSHNYTWIKLTMWAPAIALLLCDPKQVWRHLKSLSLSKFRFIPIAIGVGWIWSALYYLSLVLIGKSQWNDQFQLSTDGSSIEGIHGFGMLLGFGHQSIGFFSMNLFFTILLGSILFGLIGGLGEEIGWRAFLQTDFEKRFGVLNSTLTVGIIWGLWHIPANLAGLNNTTYPVISALITFPIFTVSLSFVFGWLQRKFTSAYFPAIAHGANNCLAAGFIIKPQDPAADLIAGICASVLLIMVSYLVFRVKPSNAEDKAR